MQPTSHPQQAQCAQLAKAFKALSNPNRLAMYMDLIQLEETEVSACCIADLIDRLDIGAPTVSHHIKELVNADLVHVTRDGKFMRCRLNRETFALLGDFFKHPTASL
ncbi:ArsR/SmtB family transcription factor [Atopomonas sediminilitoris]|uniref:ArsR/SmtB family transcription factor n=1 Tax=Atopomonas sediminilitoris TaxID=2919919 RepID=UPI001F4D958D|nr:metalloregulator ArsR/SmtB family transcription factor [Atopomonas sediminilitoris]MCJ8168258.1 metalloregulator ArsR/SmtB family transcription factor [Atopomonas sediminilitoris]